MSIDREWNSEKDMAELNNPTQPAGERDKLLQDITKLKFPITNVVIEGPQKYYTFKAEELTRLMHLIDQYTARENVKARIGEVKHRYANLILDEPDEFKWKEFAEKRIAELQAELAPHKEDTHEKH
jgi:hypothetical protein